MKVSFILLTSFSFLCNGLLSCGSNSEKVLGQVIVSQDAPLEGLNISLQQKGSNQVIATTTTGKFGFFLFSDVKKADLSRDLGGESNTQTQLCNEKGQCSDFLPLDTAICKNVGTVMIPFCGGGRIATVEDPNVEDSLFSDHVAKYSDHLAFIYQDKNAEPQFEGRFKLKPSASTSGVIVELVDALSSDSMPGSNNLTACDIGYACFPIQEMGRKYIRLRMGMMEVLPNAIADTLEIRTKPVSGKSALLNLDGTGTRIFIDVRSP